MPLLGFFQYFIGQSVHIWNLFSANSTHQLMIDWFLLETRKNKGRSLKLLMANATFPSKYLKFIGLKHHVLVRVFLRKHALINRSMFHSSQGRWIQILFYPPNTSNTPWFTLWKNDIRELLIPHKCKLHRHPTRYIEIILTLCPLAALKSGMFNSCEFLVLQLLTLARFTKTLLRKPFL